MAANSKLSNVVVASLLIIHNLVLSSVAESVDYGQCFNTTGCFGVTFDQSSGSVDTGSCIKDRNCDIIVAFKNISNGDVMFAIQGNIPPETTYWYLAAALSEDSKMGDDSVMFCYISNSVPGVGESKNEGKEGSYALENSKSNLYDTQTSYKNGILSCNFTRKHLSTIDVWGYAGKKQVAFNLTEKYHLLLASGRLKFQEQLPSKHDWKVSSGEKIDLTSKKGVGSSESDKAIVSSHGCLLVLAWMLFACVGTFTARYMFHGFPENAGFYWFQIHQVCMSLTWLLSIAGVLIQFIGVGSDPILNPANYKQNPHALIGLVSIMMMFVQPFMGFLRPSPNSKKRIVFNHVHHITGNTATVLALTAIVSATFFEGRGIPYEARYISCGFLGFYTACHISMTFSNKLRCATLRDLAPYRYSFALLGMVAFIGALLFMLLKDIKELNLKELKFK